MSLINNVLYRAHGDDADCCEEVLHCIYEVINDNK
jgi:hypothetical protein